MPDDPAPSVSLPPRLPRPQLRRLRDVFRSAGWPCHDAIEIDLLAAGLIERLRSPQGHESLRVSDAGIRVLAEAQQRNRRALSAHEALVERVAAEMARAGRIVWRGLALRAPLQTPDGTVWQIAMPDVFSIRHTSVEAYLEPVVHEIKVSRADLLADLRLAHKRAAYLALGGECWYVLREGIAAADDVPAECGVMQAVGERFEVLRPALRRPARLPFAVWMVLARATPAACSDELAADTAQGLLGDPGALA